MYSQQFSLILGRAERAQERLQAQLFLASKALDLLYAKTTEHLSFAAKDQLQYQPIEAGQAWGRSAELVWQSAWFSAKVELGAELADWQQQVEQSGAEIVLDLQFSGEGLVFDREGRIVQGISGGSLLEPDFQRSLVMNAGELLRGDQLELWIEAAANTLFGLEREDNPQRNGSQTAPRYFGEHIGRVHSARIALLDKALWHYLLDLKSTAELAQKLLGNGPSGSWGNANNVANPAVIPRARRLIYALDRSLSCHAYERKNLAKAQQILRSVLVDGVDGSTPSDLSTVAVGHAHIDTAWLWPVAETVRKCARTFSNQLRLLRQYPNYIFGASQAQHYQFVKEHYPDLYSEIKKRVAEGRWEVQGAMWVEADTNIPSGESLIRQILYGKNFFREEFGLEVTNLWLPDVFGYSANLPQILRRSGVLYFLTQKLSWSQYNTFPHHTFYWQGIDGSQVLTHFPPEATYNSILALDSTGSLGLVEAQNQFREGHILDEFMTLFGVGDGGGGPDEVMIERGQRLAEGISGAPNLRFGRADEFFTRLEEQERHTEKNAEGPKHSASGKIATWVGELYLELHRGTLTSQALTKRGNRQLEQTLRTVEYLYSLTLEDIPYPQERLDALWKMLLCNQFHDIIPGSSIHEVYQTTEEEHRKGLASCAEMLGEWADCVRQNITEVRGEDEELLLFNPFSLSQQILVKLPEGWQGAAAAGPQLKAEPQLKQASGQFLGACRIEEQAYALLRLAPQSMAIVRQAPSESQTAPVISASEDQLLLENSLIRYAFDSKGQLREIYDKEAERSILRAEGCGNLLRLYADWPRDWDAWDLDINYQEELVEELASASPCQKTATPLFQELHFQYQFGRDSRLEQCLRLETGSKRLTVSNQLHWHERHRMLRVRFDTLLRSPRFSCDIQYGYLERPTHSNTPWDMAQFEVVGQRYIDISQPDYGLTLLNDCKYGHRAADGQLELNLLRSPTLPDPEADQLSEAHRFCYALLPHIGDLQDAMPLVQAEAALLNQPVPYLRGTGQNGAGAKRWSDLKDFPQPPCSLDSRNVTLEVLKKAERSEAWVLRLVERAGARSAATLSWDSRRVSQVVECDLLEWHELAAPLVNNQSCELLFEPFAIRTFLLKRASKKSKK